MSLFQVDYRFGVFFTYFPVYSFNLAITGLLLDPVIAKGNCILFSYWQNLQSNIAVALLLKLYATTEYNIGLALRCRRQKSNKSPA